MPPRPHDIVRRLLLPRPPRGRTLHPSEHRLLAHVAEALLEDAPLPTTPAEVADNVEKFLALGRSRKIWRVRLLTHVVDWLPVTTRFHRRFTRLTLEEQRTVIREHMAEEQGLWSIAARIRLLVLMGAYGDERAANEETGYVAIPDRPWFRWPNKGVA